MARAASEYVLAHEIGHVLDLRHVIEKEEEESNPNPDPNNKKYLMYWNDGFIELPPDLSGKEGSAMRRSWLAHWC